MKKKIKKILKQVPPGYYQKLNLVQKWWHNGKFKAVKKLIPAKSGQKMLDLGCCDGVMTARLFSTLTEPKLAIGLDFCRSSIEFAQRKHPQVKFLVSDVQKINLKEKFDLIVCLETIEHVQDPQQLVAEITRLLARDGVVIVEMDSGNWLFKLVWKIWGKMGGRVWHGAHLWHTNKEGLLHLLNESDLRIEKIIDFNLGMGVAIKLKNKKYPSASSG